MDDVPEVRCGTDLNTGWSKKVGKALKPIGALHVAVSKNPSIIFTLGPPKQTKAHNSARGAKGNQRSVYWPPQLTTTAPTGVHAELQVGKRHLTLGVS